MDPNEVINILQHQYDLINDNSDALLAACGSQAQRFAVTAAEISAHANLSYVQELVLAGNAQAIAAIGQQAKHADKVISDAIGQIDQEAAALDMIANAVKAVSGVVAPFIK